MERFCVKYVRSVNEKCGILQGFIHCVHTLSRTLGSQSGSGQSGEFGEFFAGVDVDYNSIVVDSQVVKEQKAPHA